jgi:hypothetical protein
MPEKINFPIDLVYLWVDGSDLNWLKKKNAALVAIGKQPTSLDKVRYFDNEELKYSLRSAEKFAPWINHIFIVTDGQKPKWLNIKNPNITIVDHTEIMPKGILPVFNSSLIEFFIHKITNLAENFILANDDTFFGNKITPDYFFKSNGMPIIRIKNSNILKQRLNPSNNFDQIVVNSKKLAMKIYGKNHNYNWMPSHNIDPYKKSEIEQILKQKMIAKRVTEMHQHKFRECDDLQRTIIHECMIAENKVTIRKYTNLKKIFLKIIGKYDDYPQYVTHAKKLDKMRKMPKLFCINNSGANPERDTYNHNFLERNFPEKSQFEK